MHICLGLTEALLSRKTLGLSVISKKIKINKNKDKDFFPGNLPGKD